MYPWEPLKGVKLRKFFFAPLLLALAQPAHAEMTKTQYTAPNGVVVDVETDDFAGRREFASPAVEFKPDGGGSGYAIVGRVFDSGKLRDLNVQGFITYSGDWRSYNTAIFKGGAAADFHSAGHDVGSCEYGCTLTENFVINITPEQARAHAENGVVAIQLRGSSANTAIMSIPVSYIDAVAQTAH